MGVKEVVVAVVAGQEGGNKLLAIAADPPCPVLRRLHGEHVETDSHETTSVSPWPISSESRQTLVIAGLYVNGKDGADARRARPPAARPTPSGTSSPPVVEVSCEVLPGRIGSPGSYR